MKGKEREESHASVLSHQHVGVHMWVQCLSDLGTPHPEPAEWEGLELRKACLISAVATQGREGGDTEIF